MHILSSIQLTSQPYTHALYFSRIQYEKFKWHNSQWLEMVTQGNDPEIDSYDDDYLPREMMLSGLAITFDA